MKSGKFAHTARALAVAGVAMAGFAVVPVSAAHASVSNCTSDYYSDVQGWTDCFALSGYGHFRAAATCYSYGSKSPYPVYGPWTYEAGKRSVTSKCLTGYYIGDLHADTAQ